MKNISKQLKRARFVTIWLYCTAGGGALDLSRSVIYIGHRNYRSISVIEIMKHNYAKLTWLTLAQTNVLLRRFKISFGIRGAALEWFSSYLSGRSQQVSVHNVMAMSVFLDYGVPQSTVLGPVLFLLYISDLVELVRSFGLLAHAYDDDLQVYCHMNVGSEQIMLQRFRYCADSVSRWMSSNRLKLNQLNSAARLILGLKRFDHITPALMDLHWLPYPQRITYKLCMIMFKCLRGSAPAYLADYCTSTSLVPGRLALRSAAHGDIVVPSHRTDWGLRSFAGAGPSSWNVLPVGLRSSSFGLDTSAKHLKTHLFGLAYSRRGTHF